MFDLPSNRIFVIAEMANAHNGDANKARAIVGEAASSGADAIKFQVFTPDELAVPSFSNYGLYEKLQMSTETWADLVKYAHSLHLHVFCDIFGIESAGMMHQLGVDGFKIHTADISNERLLVFVGNSGLLTLLSVGGSTWLETAEALEILLSAGADSVVLMYGIQRYPTTLSDSNLRCIETLRAKFGLPLGFASHASGDSPEAVTLPIWAATGGADVIEVHITLDRSDRGPDYYSSLEAAQFAEMIKMLREMEPALGKRSLRLSTEEMEYRFSHKKWLVATHDIDPGKILEAEDVALKRLDNHPSGQPLRMKSAIGHEIVRRVEANSLIQLEDLQMKAAAVLACRAEGSRLYGKPMQLVGNRPIIQFLIDRLRRVQMIDEIVLAISDTPSREVFVEYAEREGMPYVIGPEQDVLKRLILAADLVQADIVVRTTTENPFIYWENVDDLIRKHIEQNADLTVTEGLPLGAFVEIVSLDALKKEHKYGENRHRSELCTLFIAENPDLFSIHRVAPPVNLRRPEIRLTVDTPQDLMLVRILWNALSKENEMITVEEIIHFLDSHPEIANINKEEESLYLWK